MSVMIPVGEYKGVEIFEDSYDHRICLRHGDAQLYRAKAENIEDAYQEYLDWCDEIISYAEEKGINANSGE